MSLFRQEPISLHMWIIKPVPDSQNICVEGKKSLMEENFWHSDVITERLDEKTVVTSTGSVYRLEGNMELMDAIAVGFSRSLVEAFWLGFPPDWKSLLVKHFQQTNSQLGNTMEMSQSAHSESEDDVSFVDEVDLDDTVTDMSDKTSTKSKEKASAELDEVDSVESEQQSAEDEDDIIVSEAVVDSQGETEEVVHMVTENPRKSTVKNRRAENSKDHALNKWIIKFLANGKGIYVVGEKSNGSLWHSSAIEKRLSQKKVLSCTGSVYKLIGNMDKLLALSEDLPHDIIDKFKRGFPKEWQELIQNHTVASKSRPNVAKQEKSRPKTKTTGKGNKKPKPKENEKENMNSTDKKASKTGQSNSKVSKGLTSSRSDVKNSRTMTNSQIMTAKKSVKEEDGKYESRKFVITPRGQLVDLSTLGRSRSGRLIKPPLHAWSRQSVSLEGDNVVVTAPTAGASQFLKKFEDQFQNLTRKIQPYYNPRQKDMDYSVLNKSVSNRSSLSAKNRHIGKKQSQNKTAQSDENMSKDEIGSSEDTNSSSSRLDEQVKDVLEKNKANRRQSNKKRVTCYNHQGVNTGEQTNYNRSQETFDLDETTESLDRTIVSEKSRLDDTNDEAVIGPRTRRGSNRGNSSLTRKSVANKRRTRSTKITQATEIESVSNGSRNASMAVKSSRPSRSSNSKKPVYVVITDTETEQEDTQAAEPRSARRKSNRTKTPADANRAPEKIAEVAEDCWTKEEKESLYRACKAVPVGQPNYWGKVAKLVGTKSADSCNTMFYQTEKAPVSAKKTKKAAKEKPRATAITAKPGTLKRKQQVTDILKQHNENYEDDLFNSTPFKQTRKRKMPSLNDLGDNLFEELAKKQGHKAFETPKGNLYRDGTDVPFASPEKTPGTHLNADLTEQSFQVDGYVHNVVKRQQQARRRSKRKSEPETSNPTKPKTSLSPPSMKLFHNYLNESKIDKENHADSEQDEDYYWEEETGDVSQG